MSREYANMGDWENKLTELGKKVHPAPVFVVWTASAKDDRNPPATWCADCNRVVPAIRHAAEERKAHLFEVSVGSAEEYKTGHHYLKQSEEYKSHASIPILACYQHGKLVAVAPPSLANSVSYEAAYEPACNFMDTHLARKTNPLACPHVRGGVIVGLIVVAVGICAMVYVQQQQRQSGSSSSASSNNRSKSLQK